jgi:hypothetical protein
MRTVHCLLLAVLFTSPVCAEPTEPQPPWTQADREAAEKQCAELRETALPAHWTWDLEPSPIVGRFAEHGSTFETSRGWLFIAGDTERRLAGWLTRGRSPSTQAP